MTDFYHRIQTQIQTKTGINKYYIDPVEFEELVDAFSKPKQRKQLSQFLKTLLTKWEIAELIRRWLVARMISDGLTYEEIHERTGMSPNTMVDIKQRLDDENGVLAKILARTPHLRNKDEKRRRREAALAEEPNPIDKKFRRMIDPFYEG